MALSPPLPPPPDDRFESFGSANGAGLASLAGAIRDAVEVDPHALTATERKHRLARLRSAIDGLEVAFDTTVAAADTAGAGQALDGATSTAAWLRRTLRMAPREAAGHSPAAPAAAAVLSGQISYPHLQPITGTLSDLTDLPGLPADAPAQAVTLMVDLATTVDPAGLRAAARHLRYVLDPDRGKADHDRQTQIRRATLAPLLDGTWRLEMLTTAEGGALLTQLLAASGAPTSNDDPRTPTQRRHDALIDALQAAAQSDQLPIANGLSPQILVTAPPNAFLPNETTEEPLPDQWRPARFADGSPIPGPLFDQLSCNPTLTRIIQEPTGKVLDVGRTHRFFTSAQRAALWARDRG
ncbi:MAG: 13E12 repeat family protein, partial [Actinomycetia bacterium]|nr:13E12 repeat family protein [Actinomycetes bacterium]